ncbi:MAG: hypothetical protein ACYCZB_14850 [Acidiphilium sp.]
MVTIQVLRNTAAKLAAGAKNPFHPALIGYFDKLLDRASARRIIREARPYFHLFPFRDALNPRFTSPGL